MNIHLLMLKHMPKMIFNIQSILIRKDIHQYSYKIRKNQKITIVVDDKDGMPDDSVLERRSELATAAKKTIRSGFHTITLNNVKVLSLAS